MLRQVRLGTAVDVERNPDRYRAAGVAVDPGLLSTGLLAVGPTGSGKTLRVVRPVVASLCLQALTGQAAMVVVTDRGDACAPADWFDVVLDASAAPAEERAPVLDLFGGRDDADEAGALAAEALVGDLSGSLPGGELRAAVTTLAQLIGPHRAVYGRWPEVHELRDLLEGGAPLEELWATVEAKRMNAELRELAAVRRQLAAGADVAGLLADRVAVLDRPALAGICSPAAAGTVLDRLDLPVRVRVDLPEGVHAQAGRILTRLILAKFAADAPRRQAGSPWPCLVLDDATGAITGQSLEALQRIRAAGCGFVLALRALSDVPEHLRQPLVSVAGCRIVCAGIAPWDAQHFADAWGTEVVEDVTVTDRQVHAEYPMQKVMYGLRKIVTGKDITLQAVSTRRERRQRWPADDLATEVPGGHAVISVTAPDGRRSSPILTRLGDR